MKPRRIIEGTVRTALRLLPASTVVPIVRGPLRGLWWVSGSAPHGVWLDTIERASLRDFSRHVQPRATVWDIGANVGLYSLLAGRCVGPAGSVVAFEPAATNVAALRRHAALNRMDNIRIVPAAVWNVSGIVRLERGDSRSEFHVSGAGATEVQSVALDAWREEHRETAPAVMKIDVEGAEVEVLEGGAATIHASRPRIYLALHGERQQRRCEELLRSWGYRFETADGCAWCRDVSEWIAVPD